MADAVLNVPDFAAGWYMRVTAQGSSGSRTRRDTGVARGTGRLVLDADNVLPASEPRVVISVFQIPREHIH